MKLSDLDDVQAAVDKYPFELQPIQDMWDRMTELGCGQCTNYCMEKRARLIDLGWPVESIHIGIVEVEPAARQPGVNHAVLVVKTDEGEKVLDQRQTYVTTIDELAHMGYQPVEWQDPASPTGWSEWFWREYNPAMNTEESGPRTVSGTP